MALCGAKTRSGEPCKRHAAVGSTRCKLHGGRSTGPRNQTGNRNAARPGSLYSRFLSDEEQGIAASIELGNVDEELRLTRIRLMRALQREQDKGGEAELDERVERDGAENVTARMEEKYKVRDYSSLIDKLTARVESLEARRAALVAAALDAEIKQLDVEKRRSELAALLREQAHDEQDHSAPPDYKLEPDEDVPATPIL